LPVNSKYKRSASAIRLSSAQNLIGYLLFNPPLIFFIAFFGVSEQGEFKISKTRRYFFLQKYMCHLGSSQKNVAFFVLRFFPPRLFCLIFLIAFFWAFRDKGRSKYCQKRDSKNRGNFKIFRSRSRQKLMILTCVTFFSPTAPLGPWF
jgi:hypothetical protein